MQDEKFISPRSSQGEFSFRGIMQPKKTVAIVDGGHLREAIKGVAETASKLRHPLAVPSTKLQFHVGLLEAVCNDLFDASDEDKVRILFYDCAGFSDELTAPITGAKFTKTWDDEWLRRLAVADMFAVRRGVLKFRGWELRDNRRFSTPLKDGDFKPKIEQKGVDLKIGLDIAQYARERSVDRLVVVTGDTDLVPAIKLARKSGIQIVGVQVFRHVLVDELKQHFDIVRQRDWRDDYWRIVAPGPSE